MARAALGAMVTSSGTGGRATTRRAPGCKLLLRTGVCRSEAAGEPQVDHGRDRAAATGHGLGERPMTDAERQARCYARKRDTIATWFMALERVWTARTAREARAIAEEALAEKPPEE